MSISKKKTIVAVIGGHKCSNEVEEIAMKLGKLLAKVGVTLVCGGLNGVMKAVSRGMQEGGGVTVGILPGENKQDANPYVDIPIPTGLGYTRNTLVAGCADIIIALAGEYGTLSEIAFALNMKKPVIGIGSWDIKGMRQVNTPEEAVALVKTIVNDTKGTGPFVSLRGDE
ncbi:MAG: TIGR00725 family protein [Candidatus Omnitrophota bacterium]